MVDLYNLMMMAIKSTETVPLDLPDNPDTQIPTIGYWKRIFW